MMVIAATPGKLLSLAAVAIVLPVEVVNLAVRHRLKRSRRGIVARLAELRNHFRHVEVSQSYDRVVVFVDRSNVGD